MTRLLLFIILFIVCAVNNTFCAYNNNSSPRTVQAYSPRSVTDWPTFMASMYKRPATDPFAFFEKNKKSITAHTINSKNARGQNIVHLWAEYASTGHGKLPTISYLLELKADINLQDNSGSTPLNLFMEGTEIHSGFIKQLIEVRANVTLKNNSQETALDTLKLLHKDKKNPARKEIIDGLITYLEKIEKEQLTQNRDKEKTESKKQGSL